MPWSKPLPPPEPAGTCLDSCPDSEGEGLRSAGATGFACMAWVHSGNGQKGEPVIKPAEAVQPNIKMSLLGLIREATRDDRIVGITAAMPDGTSLGKFASAHPHRFYDVGIAEEHAVTFAAGLAAAGETYSAQSTPHSCSRHSIKSCTMLHSKDLPVTFAMDRAGLVGADGATHQGAFDIAYLRMIPNMVVMAPCNEIGWQVPLPPLSCMTASSPFGILEVPVGVAIESNPQATHLEGAAGSTAEAPEVTIRSGLSRRLRSSAGEPPGGGRYLGGCGGHGGLQTAG